MEHVQRKEASFSPSFLLFFSLRFNKYVLWTLIFTVYKQYSKGTLIDLLQIFATDCNVRCLYKRIFFSFYEVYSIVIQLELWKYENSRPSVR